MDRNEKLEKIREILEYLEIDYEDGEDDDNFEMFFDDNGVIDVIVDTEDNVILQFFALVPPPTIAFLTETFINHGLSPDYYDVKYTDFNGNLYLGKEAVDIRTRIINFGMSQVESINQSQSYMQ